MVWFKVDDALHSHPKALAAGDAALGVWVRLGSWCGQHLTDGHIPLHVAQMLAKPALLKRLVEVGLVDRVADGYLLHDWLDYNPSRAKVEHDRGVTAARVTRFREARNAVTEGVTHAVGTASPTRPDPTRPEVGVETGLVKAPTTTPLARSASVREPAGFAEFYAAYPRHVGRRTAATAYERALRRAPAQVILAAARDLADDPNLPEQSKVPHPATWLNRDGWGDDPYPVRLHNDNRRSGDDAAREAHEAGQRVLARRQAALERGTA